MRKVLPAVPDLETQVNMSAKLINQRISTSKGKHSYGPFFLEYSLLAEYNLLQKQKLPGVYVIPSAKSPLQWFGVLFIRQGIYQEGVFRFDLHIPDNFPDGNCPQLVLEVPVFHPLVDPETGVMDVRRGFNRWHRNQNHIWQLLLYTRKAFYRIDTNQPLNPEAAVMYEKDREMYKFKVNESVKACKHRVYDEPRTNDLHAIKFSEYQSELHDATRKSLYSYKMEELNPNSTMKGMSWIQPSTLSIFSKSSS